MLNLFLYYLFFSSSVLIYGIGIEHTVIKEKESNVLFLILKLLLNLVVCSSLGFIINKYLLAPIGLVEVFPFVAFFLLVITTTTFESAFRLLNKKNVIDFCLMFLIVLVSVFESITLVECLVISLTCFVSLIVTVFVIDSIKKRIESATVNSEFKMVVLTFISLAIMSICLMSWNISWLNGGN